MMEFGDKNPADVLKDPMWQMFRTFGQKANMPKLKEYVYNLIQMSAQKSAGQAGRNSKHVSWEEELHMTLWGIVIEACALVLDGRKPNECLNTRNGEAGGMSEDSERRSDIL